MQLKIPKSLHYPLTVTQVFKKEGDSVRLNDPLFEYSYEAYRREGDRYGNEKDVLRKFSTRFESPFEGKLRNWRPWEKEVISEPCGPLLVAEVPNNLINRQSRRL